MAAEWERRAKISWYAHGLMGAAAEIASNTDSASSMPKELRSLPQKRVLLTRRS